MLSARVCLVPLFIAGLLSSAGDARAQGGAECNAAYEQAEVIVHATRSDKLVSAREKLRICSRPSCKPWMVRECTKWLDEIEDRIPTVVLAARDGKGAEISDASVTLDGAPFATSLDGRAIGLDPGEHTFVFTRPDGRHASQRLIVKEGVKAQLVTVSLDASQTASPRANAAPTRTPDPALAEDDHGAARLRVVGFAVGGVGIAGLVVGGIFGLRTFSKKSDASCENGACDPGALSEARSAATISTIAIAGGGLLLAGGITLVLLAPRLALPARVGLAMGASGVGMEGTW
jgi:hypothetical protein